MRLFRRNKKEDKKAASAAAAAKPKAKTVDDGDDKDMERPPSTLPDIPPMLPKLQPGRDVNFFIPKPDGEKLACTLIRSADEKQRSNLIRVETGGFVVDTSKPVIIFTHGHQSWRNQMLFPFLGAKLSDQVHCHSLRFDFTGNGHSTGPWRYADFEREAKDLERVVEFVRTEMKCRVLCLFGHSKGTHAVLDVARHEETNESKDRIPYFVIASARYRRPNQLAQEERISSEQKEELQREGKITLKHPMGPMFVLTMEDWENCRDLDTTFVEHLEKAKFLVLHGTKDQAVPEEDAWDYRDYIPQNKTVIFDGADHNYNGLKHIAEIVTLVAELLRT